jgi:hypothetical protein
MVPGMTERALLCAESQRLEWLAGAVVGPARVSGAASRPLGGNGPRPAQPVASWRQSLASVLIQFRRFLVARPRIAINDITIAEAPAR